MVVSSLPANVKETSSLLIWSITHTWSIIIHLDIGSPELVPCFPISLPGSPDNSFSDVRVLLLVSRKEGLHLTRTAFAELLTPFLFSSFSATTWHYFKLGLAGSRIRSRNRKYMFHSLWISPQLCICFLD